MTDDTAAHRYVGCLTVTCRGEGIKAITQRVVESCIVASRQERIQKLGLGGYLQCPFLGNVGTEPRRRRHRQQDAKGVEKLGSGEWLYLSPVPFPSRLGSLGSVVSSPSGVLGGAPVEIEFCKIWIPKKPWWYVFDHPSKIVMSLGGIALWPHPLGLPLLVGTSLLYAPSNRVAPS